MKFKKKDAVKGHLTIVMSFSGEALLVQSEMKKKKNHNTTSHSSLPLVSCWISSVTCGLRSKQKAIELNKYTESPTILRP